MYLKSKKQKKVKNIVCSLKDRQIKDLTDFPTRYSTFIIGDCHARKKFVTSIYQVFYFFHLLFFISSSTVCRFLSACHLNLSFLFFSVPFLFCFCHIQFRFFFFSPLLKFIFLPPTTQFYSANFFSS